MKRIVGALLAVVAATALAALPGTTSRNDFTGNGSTTAFTFTFKATTATWVAVYLGGVKQTSGYVVSLNANQTTSPGGTVTFTPAPASGATVRIQREVPLTQDSVWTPYSAFRATTLENQLDRLVMQDQQIQRELDDGVSLTGPQGLQGATGATGPTGATGAKGDTGNLTTYSDLDMTGHQIINLAAGANAYSSISWQNHWSSGGGVLKKYASGLVYISICGNVDGTGQNEMAILPAGYRPDAFGVILPGLLGTTSPAIFMAIITGSGIDGGVFVRPAVTTLSTSYCLSGMYLADH